jgi:hypothetical protein
VLLASAALTLLPEVHLLAQEPSEKPSARSVIPPAEGSEAQRPVYKVTDGKAQAAMFGLVGEGYKFAYVVDRSGSMGGAGKVALRAVKEELARSLETLDSIHQIQIIFYNEKPVLFNPSGARGRLAFATEANKQRAVRFMETITAEGGTRHDDALMQAIALHPDVIFWLTDGDKPQLTADEIEKIAGKAAGIIIHAIEFGIGPAPAEKSFLAVLARKTGGKYAYVDLSGRLRRAKP